MSARPRTIRKSVRTGSLSADNARATAFLLTRPIKTKRRKAKKGGKRRRANAAFMKVMTPTGPLRAVVGGDSLPRTEVTRKIWGYIKRNRLLENKKTGPIRVNADEKLRPVFGGKSNVSMFEMTKLVSKHLK